MEIVRTCTKCETQDTSHMWPSLDEAAAAAGAIGFTWACPSCAGPEFEFAERGLDDPVAAGAVSGAQPSAPTLDLLTCGVTDRTTRGCGAGWIDGVKLVLNIVPGNQTLGASCVTFFSGRPAPKSEASSTAAGGSR